MTHDDIYTKYLIEYDKANVTSSYPSLTKYEAATILDKAYKAVIAQKVTGNNPRQAGLEQDAKSIADLQQLVKHTDLQIHTDSESLMGANIVQVELPTDFLYYVQMMLEYNATPSSTIINDSSVSNETFQGETNNGILDPNELFTGNSEELPQQIDWNNLYYASTIGDQVNSIAEGLGNQVNGPYDNKIIRLVPVKLTSHDVAERFIVTPYNMPWVKNPVAYMESNTVNVVYDPINKPLVGSDNAVHFVYIKKPAPFATVTLDSNDQETKSADFSPETQFELSDAMAEEVINMAVIMTLENVESQRLNSKLSTRGLEA